MVRKDHRHISLPGGRDHRGWDEQKNWSVTHIWPRGKKSIEKLSSQGHVIRVKFFKFLETCFFFRELDHLESFGEKNFFRQLCRRVTRDRATVAIFGLKYLRKLKRNRGPVFFCCSQSLFCTFWPKMIEISIVLSEILSKNCYFKQFTRIF